MKWSIVNGIQKGYHLKNLNGDDKVGLRVKRVIVYLFLRINY